MSWGSCSRWRRKSWTRGAGTGAATGSDGAVAAGGCMGAPPEACAMHEVAKSPKMRSNCIVEEPMF